ncbi:hypothetical protein [uncultured Tateyamaria sp.]|uniref:hypothetical protein n=1 Tax=uncultured Tateyamaria sp. TaxID=455651 RepID=UPI00263420D6|nr:hypothetical protein [uncultured Tateyamaria sp.]
MAHGQDIFAERLARLNDTHGHRQKQQTATARAARGRTPDWVRNMVYPGSLVGACFVGILTVILSRYVMFHMNGAPDPDGDADLTMLMDGGLALAIAFVLRNALNMSSKEHLACKTAGIWIALTCMHNLVHAYPMTWANAFSPEWVERTVEMTEPKSIFFRGMSFTLDDKAPEAEPVNTDPSIPTSKPEIKINRG